MIGLFFFLFGSVIGSFANVCIWRIPRKKSIIYPFSQCPKCSAYLKWYENIPMLSYLFLKGTCRYCGGKISPHYPLIESFTGLLFLLLYLNFSLSKDLFFSIVLTTFLFVASGIDYFHRIIPDKLTYSLIIFGLSFSFFNPFLSHNPLSVVGYSLFAYHNTLHLTRFFYALSSALLAGLLLYLIAISGEKIFKKEAMGGGDVKLLAGIAAFLGIAKAIWIIFLASLIGGLVGISRILYRKYYHIHSGDDAIPFAPYLSIATFVILIFWAS